VGTGWLAVGILTDRQGVSVQALQGLGVDSGAVTEGLREVLREQRDV